MPDDYKKYQLIRTAALFGFAIIENEDKIMLTNGPSKIFIGKEPIPDVVFLDHVQKLKMGYNRLRTSALKPWQDKSLESKMYDIKDFSKDTPAQEAYTEEDPLIYTATLLQDLDSYGGDSTNRFYREIILKQMENSVNRVGKTTWGKRISESLDAFWKTNDYILERGRGRNSQPGE